MDNRNSFTRKSPVTWLNLLLASAIFFAAIPLHAQNPKEPRKLGDQDDVVRVTSNLVNLDVMVKDKKGKPITDLKADDFVLSENGVPQKIEFFDSTLTGGSEPAQQNGGLSVSTSPRRPGALPRNIISLVLDGQTTEGPNLKHVRDGMTKYIRDRVTKDDLVALFAISGGLQLLQPFTQDQDKLISAVERSESISTTSKTSEQRGINESMAAIRDYLAGAPTGEITTPAGGSAAAQAMIARRILEQYVQMRSTLSAQQSRPVLAGLAAICEGLRSIPGKKTVVVFSQGFIAPQNLDWQVQSTIDIATRANVAIYFIDASGLTGGTPQSGALVPGSALSGISAATSQENRIRAGAGESVFDITRQEGLNRQQDLLYRISGDTGGQFIKNTNDIVGGLERIDEEIRSRYTLAYRSTNSNFDGTFRKVKIEVRRPDVKVMARSGYYAIPPTQIVPLSPEDNKLLANFDALLLNSTLPLSLEVSSFRAQPGFYTVPLSFEIPPDAIAVEKKANKQLLQLDVLGLVRTEGDEKVLSRLGGNFDIELTPTQYESILSDKIFYRQDMLLPAGSYTIDLIVKDKLSGKKAAKRQKLVLPDTDAEFAASNAVLSRHAEPTLARLNGAADVLSAGNVLIRPSPSREFHPTDNLIIFFELYNTTPAAEAGKTLAKVTVTLMKDGKPAIKPLNYDLSQVVSEPMPHLTFAKYVKLVGLASGKYTAVIEAIDVGKRKVLKQELPFQIVQ